VIVFFAQTIQSYSAWPDTMISECSNKVVSEKKAVYTPSIPIKYKNKD